MARTFDPSFPFYCNEWLSSPAIDLMSLAEQGAFIRLLCFCWASQDVSLPDDDDFLAKASRLKGGWITSEVRKEFIPHPLKTGFLTNKKLFDIWQEREDYRADRVRDGIKSAEVRAEAKRKAIEDQKNQVPLKKRVEKIEGSLKHLENTLQGDSKVCSTLPLPLPLREETEDRVKSD